MRRVARTGVLCGLCLAACGERVPPAVQHQNSLLPTQSRVHSLLGPASYRYHPMRQAPMQTERRLDDGRLLLAGKRGERWLLDPVTHNLTAGANLAPEDLIAVLDADDGYFFIGQSGTSYQA